MAPTLKATIDQLSDDERRDLLHYLEQTVEDVFVLTDDQIREIERRDAELASGVAAALGVDQLMQQVRGNVR